MLKVSLVTPAKKILSDVEVAEVFVPTEKGEINILEGHAPLMALLGTGVFRYRAKNGEPVPVAISWGYLEVSADNVTVLAETAETADAIDVARAEEAKQKAEKALSGGDLEQQQFRKYQLKLERAMIRIQVATQRSDTTH